jgi:hypothetical protein
MARVVVLAPGCPCRVVVAVCLVGAEHIQHQSPNFKNPNSADSIGSCFAATGRLSFDILFLRPLQQFVVWQRSFKKATIPNNSLIN